jgi:hypothetical protein
MTTNIERATRVAKRLREKGFSVTEEWVRFQVRRHADYVDAGGGSESERVERLVDCLVPLAKKKS